MDRRVDKRRMNESYKTYGNGNGTNNGKGDCDFIC